jgi:hypothetical protein
MQVGGFAHGKSYATDVAEILARSQELVHPTHHRGLAIPTDAEYQQQSTASHGIRTPPPQMLQQNARAFHHVSPTPTSAEQRPMKKAWEIEVERLRSSLQSQHLPGASHEVAVTVPLTISQQARLSCLRQPLIRAMALFDRPCQPALPQKRNQYLPTQKIQRRQRTSCLKSPSPPLLHAMPRGRRKMAKKSAARTSMYTLMHAFCVRFATFVLHIFSSDIEGRK